HLTWGDIRLSWEIFRVPWMILYLFLMVDCPFRTINNQLKPPNHHSRTRDKTTHHSRSGLQTHHRTTENNLQCRLANNLDQLVADHLHMDLDRLLVRTLNQHTNLRLNPTITHQHPALLTKLLLDVADRAHHQG